MFLVCAKWVIARPSQTPLSNKAIAAIRTNRDSEQSSVESICQLECSSQLHQCAASPTSRSIGMLPSLNDSTDSDRRRHRQACNQPIVRAQSDESAGGCVSREVAQ